MSKITAYGQIANTSVVPSVLLPVVDPNDTTMAPSGTTKKMTLSQLVQDPDLAVVQITTRTFCV